MHISRQRFEFSACALVLCYHEEWHHIRGKKQRTPDKFQSVGRILKGIFFSKVEPTTFWLQILLWRNLRAKFILSNPFLSSLMKIYSCLLKNCNFLL